jgi:hypothetical protein
LGTCGSHLSEGPTGRLPWPGQQCRTTRVQCTVELVCALALDRTGRACCPVALSLGSLQRKRAPRLFSPAWLHRAASVVCIGLHATQKRSRISQSSSIGAEIDDTGTTNGGVPPNGGVIESLATVSSVKSTFERTPGCQEPRASVTTLPAPHSLHRGTPAGWAGLAMHGRA